MKRMLAITLALSLSCMSGAIAEESTTSVPTESVTESASMATGLQELVEKGIISQETLDAINAYLAANQPEMPSGTTGDQSAGNPPSMPEVEQPGGDNGQSSDNPPAMPDGDQSGTEQPSGNPPAMPNGDQSSTEQPSGNPPAKPEGDQSGTSGSAPEMPDGGQPMGMMLSQTQLEALLSNGIITQDEYEAISDWLSESSQNMTAPDGNPPSGGGFGGMGASGNVTYTAAATISAASETSGETYASSTADESALIVDTTEEVTVDQATVTKTGDSDGGDNCNFYGLNAAVLAKDGAQLTITNSTISSSANGANGVFSYGGNGGTNGAAGDGTTVTIADTTITTTGDGSGGIMTAGGGVTYANNLTIETSGRSSAAIRTDRGGGTVIVEGGSYTTNGLGSPAIYSTADITVSDATLTSNLSEGVCIEGKNSISLTDCDLTVTNTQCNGNATFLDSIMIYQSMSGDADSGTSSFSMVGGSLTSNSGHVFHVTNTHAVITLNGVAITNNDAANVLLSVCDDGWNGASNQAEFNAANQVLTGTVLVGSNSTLNLTLTDGSSLTGSVSGEISNSRGETVSTEVGEVNVTLDSTSTWTLTADSYITSFTGDASQIIANGYTLYVNGTALEGTN